MGFAALREGQAGLPTPLSTRSFWHQEPSAVLLGHRTTEHLPATADVVVIGSGITGAFAARELAASGRNVLVLEAREACWGATGRNGGHCQPAVYSNRPHLARFELATYHFLEDLVAKHNIPCDWVRVGGVHALPTKELVELVAKRLENLQRKHPDLADKAVLFTHRKELEELRVPRAAGAVVQPFAAKCWPYKLVAWVFEMLLREYGPEQLNLQTGTPVTHLQKAEGATTRTSLWVVHTPRGQVVAREVLLATNAYTSHLLPRMTGVIVPVRGQVAALKPPSGSVMLGHSHVWLAERSDNYLVQRDGQGGGHRQPGPIIVGGERLSVAGGEEGVWQDDEINKEVAHRLRRSLASVLKLRPEGESEEEELEAAYEWTGIMGYSADGFPFVGNVPEGLGGGPGLWICAGYTGHGMPVAARCAVAVAEMMMQRNGGEGSVKLPREFEVTEERVEMAREVELPRDYVEDLRSALMEMEFNEG